MDDVIAKYLTEKSKTIALAFRISIKIKPQLI